MAAYHRQDLATAKLIDEAIRLRDLGRHATSLKLLSDVALDMELIGRVLCDPQRRRARPPPYRRRPIGDARVVPPAPPPSSSPGPWRRLWRALRRYLP